MSEQTVAEAAWPSGVVQRVAAGARLPSADFARSVVGPLVTLGTMVVVFWQLNANFLTVDNGLNILRQSAVLLVIAVAGTFVILMGSIDLSVGSLVTLTTIFGTVMLRDYHSDWFLLLIPLLGLAAGFVNGVLFAYAALPSFLVTLGTLFAFDGLWLYISAACRSRCARRPASTPSSTGTTSGGSPTRSCGRS
jgi:ribose transport system permease protein/putative xylitol transport system permease protein